MLAKILDIMHFEAVALQTSNRHPEMVKLPSRKNVTDECSVFCWIPVEASVVTLGRKGNGMM